MRLGDEVLVIDIETLERPEESWHKKKKLDEAQFWYETKLDYIHNTYKKEETRERHAVDAAKEFEKRCNEPSETWRFSPAGASIVALGYCVGTKTEWGMRWSPIGGVQGSEESCVFNLSSFINRHLSNGFTLAGYNILGFDWPVLARAFKTNGAPIDKKPSDYVFDVMDAPLFKRNRKSQDYWCQQYGISGNYETDGSMVASMWVEDEKNNTQKVLEYCQRDVEKCCKLIDINYAVFNL